MCNKFEMNLPTHICEENRQSRSIFIRFFSSTTILNTLPIYPVCIEFLFAYLFGAFDLSGCLLIEIFAIEIILLYRQPTYIHMYHIKTVVYIYIVPETLQQDISAYTHTHTHPFPFPFPDCLLFQ